MKIKITINGETEVTATIYDNPTAIDFISMLPLTVTLTDYAGTEKVFDPPGSLSKTGAPVGYDPSVGDITCYAPWGNIAIFYKDFDYASGLICIGKIDGNGINALKNSGNVSAKFELVE